MSKYSRTRRAILRVNHLNIWMVNREYFRKYPVRTMKESYKRKRKRYLKFLGKLPEGYSYILGTAIPFPCKYKEALKHFILYHECQ